MRILAAFLCLCLCLSFMPANAQDTPENATETTSSATTTPELQLRDTKTREFEEAPVLRLRILDKVRAASRTYELEVGKTVAYANLRIRPRACRKSSPLDEPESAAFLQVWEVKPDGTSAWVFSGWMFASSPSLSAMDHAVYDVTVLECKTIADPDHPEDGVEDTPASDDSDTQAQSVSTNDTDNDSAASNND